MILRIDHTWFSYSHQSTFFEPKQVFLLYTNTKVTCKNTLVNHSNGWHFILLTCFHCKTYCASLSVAPGNTIPQMEGTITMQILAHFAHFDNLFLPL